MPLSSPASSSPYMPSVRGTAIFVVVFGSFLLLALNLGDAYSLHFLWKILFWALVAAAWNIAGGYAGQFSLGHAAFFGIGAYTSTLLNMHFGISPWIGMFVGGGLAAVFATFLAMLTLRLKGPFFALASIAFAEVVRIAVVNWRSLTGGSEGISIRFAPGLENMMFTSRASSVLIVLAAVALVFVLTSVLERSSFGYRLAAMREDEEAAESLGIDTKRLKVQSIALSAFLTALAGVFYAQYILLIDPESVLSTGLSVEIALICIIGGMGTAIGPLIGAILIVPMSEYLRAEFAGGLQGLYLLVYGALLIVMVIFMPLGFISAIRNPRETAKRLRNVIGGSKRPRRLSVERGDA
jgi:branched-chain amino acid transport system permease protein